MRRPTLLPCLRRLALLASFVLASGSGVAQGLVNGCAESARDACLYRAAPQFTTRTLDLLLTDPARDHHPVPIRVRYPVGATGARPVVIWNHGGATTGADGAATAAAGFTVTRGQQSSARRSESFAKAGYVVIHVGRLAPATLTNAQLADCTRAAVAIGGAGGLDAAALAACRTWIGFHLYGPQNVAFVVDMLQHYRVGMLPGFEGTLDRERIVVGGWSGGTEATLNIAGARQRWSTSAGTVTLAPVPVPGVVAFFADAPRGAEWAGYASGFQEDSSWGIGSRPFLFNTARDDRTDSEGVPVGRTAHFFGAAKGGKLLSYSWTPASEGGPNHATMNINDAIDEATGEPAAGCNNALREAHCVALESLGVAFLDAYVRQLPAAQDWLASGNFKVLTVDRIELHRR